MQLSADESDISFAVRSSATAEDMPDASLLVSKKLLNVQGIDAVMVAIKHVLLRYLMTGLSHIVSIKGMIIVVWRFLLESNVWYVLI